MPDHANVSCPFCGARSDVPLPAASGIKTAAKSHTCPMCGYPWIVKVTLVRGRKQLLVQPDMAGAAKLDAKKKKPKAAKKAPTRKKSKAAKKAPTKKPARRKATAKASRK